MIFEIVNNLQQIINNSNDTIIIKSISNIIIKMNNVNNDNKKNTQLIINQITLFFGIKASQKSIQNFFNKRGYILFKKIVVH